MSSAGFRAKVQMLVVCGTDWGRRRGLIVRLHFRLKHLTGSQFSAEMDSIADIQVKELNKRTSGHAFEVILSPCSTDPKDFPLSPLRKKEPSLDEIQKKLDAAEERRKSGAEVMKHLAEQQEHAKEVLQKAFEESCNYKKKALEKLTQKMESYEENRAAWMTALNEKFKEKDKKLEEVKRNKEAMKARN